MNTQDSPNPEECRKLLKANQPPHVCQYTATLILKDGRVSHPWCPGCGKWAPSETQ